MTPPRPETREREKDKLFVTDAEMIRRLGVPEKAARAAIRALDRDYRRTGFPQKQALWGKRRWWPAVVAYFDHTYGFKSREAPKRNSWDDR